MAYESGKVSWIKKKKACVETMIGQIFLCVPISSGNIPTNNVFLRRLSYLMSQTTDL